MALTPGTRIGGYEVIALLGSGGMGEVYRARDPRLQRDVALKILPDQLAGDTDRLARFEREAQALAALAHPNIGHIYGFEDGRALVLELIEGPTLAERLAQAPLTADEAIAVARQIVDALDTAHERGIIHRDLKPANIKLLDDGTVKVLDFGLAKFTDDRWQADGDAVGAHPASLSPTMSAAFTGAGLILGTAAYMSPEQARGKAVDKRTDIWAFGCVLFEMLTGTRAFDGTDATEMIAAVVRGEPEWSLLPATTPSGLRRLIERCLHKDPRRRLRDIGDARFELDQVFAQEAPAPTAPVRATPRWRRLLPVAAAWLVGAALTGSAVTLLRPDTHRPVSRYDILLREGESFAYSGRHIVAISPDGARFVYTFNGELYLRERNRVEAAPIKGAGGPDRTDADGARNPFFSPDGQWVGYWQEGAIRKIPVGGGTPVAVADADNPFGASWADDDTILYAQGGRGIFRVPARGGTGALVIKAAPLHLLHGPQLLPGGRAILYTDRVADGTWDTAQIVVQSVGSNERKTVINGGYDARYLPTGHLVYAVNNGLFAARFDAGSLTLESTPVPLVTGVAASNSGQTGAAQFTVARDGTLIYVSGNADGKRTSVWVDRDGRELPTGMPARSYAYGRISPDGRRVALDVREGQNDIWVWDLVRRTLSRLTFDATVNRSPVWSPDGTRIAYSNVDDTTTESVYLQAADGAAAPDALLKRHGERWVPLSWSRDGQVLVTQTGRPWDLAMVSATGAHEFRMLLNGPSDETNGEVSPNGHWLAYQSNESGRNEVYVRPYPDVSAGKWQVSTQGGTRPAWAHSGKELFYFVQDSLMATPVEASATFAAGVPVRFPWTGYIAPLSGRTYDVAPDDRRFLMLKATQEDRNTRATLHVVENWFEELRERTSR